MFFSFSELITRRTPLFLFISILIFTLTAAKFMEGGVPAVEEKYIWPLDEDENVVAMTEKSYTDYMNDKGGVVLFFYDSNSSACRKLAPEYAAAAKFLKGEDDDVVFGMVDADESAREFFIIRYPTMCFLLPGGRFSYFDFQESNGNRYNYQFFSTIKVNFQGHMHMFCIYDQFLINSQG